MTTCDAPTAAQHAIVINQGSSFLEAYQLLASDGVTPIDCTGWTAEAVLRVSATERYPFVVTAIDLVTGRFEVSMDDSVTATIRKGRFQWQMNLVNGTDDIRWVEGRAVVSDDIREG